MKSVEANELEQPQSIAFQVEEKREDGQQTNIKPALQLTPPPPQIHIYPGSQSDVAMTQWLRIGKAAKLVGFKTRRLRRLCDHKQVVCRIDPLTRHRTVNIIDLQLFVKTNSSITISKVSEERVLCYSIAETKAEATLKLKCLLNAFRNTFELCEHAKNDRPLADTKLDAVESALLTLVFTREID
jgi:hypothetical protein